MLQLQQLLGGGDPHEIAVRVLNNLTAQQVIQLAQRLRDANRDTTLALGSAMLLACGADPTKMAEIMTELTNGNSQEEGDQEGRGQEEAHEEAGGAAVQNEPLA